MAASISDVVSRHSNGRPQIINLYDASNRKMILREKQFFYENGQIKAKGVFIGSDSGRWTFYSIDGKKLINPIELPIELTDENHKSDFGNTNVEKAINKVQDNQKIILQKIESLEKGQQALKKNLASNAKAPSKNNKQQPKADPNKVYNVAVGNSFVKGNPNAKVTITYWTDFQ